MNISPSSMFSEKRIMNNENKYVVLLNTGSDNMTLKKIFRDNVHYPPFGLLNLYSFLTLHGYRVEIVDIYTNALSTQDFLDKMMTLAEPAIAVGISTYTENFALAENLIVLVKKIFPQTKIIMGGPHVSFLPDEAFKMGADYVVLFEGESSLLMSLEHIKYPDALPIENIKGVAYRKDSKTVINPRREYIRNLDYIPLTLQQYDENNCSDTVYLLTSHGCPAKCIFCASAAFSGNKFRMHSAEWIVSFIYYFYQKYKPSRVNFVDDNFMVNKKRLKKVFMLLNRLKMKIIWDARCRIDQLDESFIRFLSDAGCKNVHLGVESGDQAVLDSINKRISLESFFKYFKMLVAGGIRPSCSFIIGHHSDTPETIEKTLLLAHKIESSNLGNVAVGIATPFPGTFLT